MKIITEPTVTVIASSMLHEPLPYAIPADGTDMERLCAFAAKNCYQSWGEDGRGNCDNQSRVIEQKHGSVLEHGVVTLLIEGVSRSLTHELIRHRAGMAYSELSQRYVDVSDVAFVEPPMLGPVQDWVHEIWRNLCREALDAYGDLIGSLVGGRKQVREAARAVLPNCTETKIVVTGNLRAWRHFLEMRSHRSADAEIRRLTNYVYEALRPLSPTHFADYTAELVDGFNEYTTPHAKV